MQARVDAFYDQFVNDVARGRGVSPDTVRSGYGRGGVLMAQEALAEGMVDAVGTLEDAIRAVARQTRATGVLSARAEGDTGDVFAQDDEPDEYRPLRERIHALASDAESVVASAVVRAGLRRKEHRPAFSPTVLASLRSSRDALSELLATVDPEATAPAPETAADPPEQGPPPAQPAPPRFRSRAEWRRYMGLPDDG